MWGVGCRKMKMITHALYGRSGVLKTVGDNSYQQCSLCCYVGVGCCNLKVITRTNCEGDNSYQLCCSVGWVGCCNMKVITQTNCAVVWGGWGVAT